MLVNVFDMRIQGVSFDLRVNEPDVRCAAVTHIPVKSDKNHLTFPADVRGNWRSGVSIVRVIVPEACPFTLISDDHVFACIAPIAIIQMRETLNAKHYDPIIIVEPADRESITGATGTILDGNKRPIALALSGIERIAGIVGNRMPWY